MSDAPVLDFLTTMTAASIERAELDAGSLALVRLAALVASDAPAASYLLNIGATAEAGLETRDVQSVLIAVAPIVGTARVMTAAGNIATALGVAVEVLTEELARELAEDG